MLGGIDPVVIFQFRKKASTFIGPQQQTFLEKIPFVALIPTFIEEPPIPIYLSQQITGLMIDTESKNVDIETDTETRTDGKPPDLVQKGIASVVSITIKAKKDSVGVALISAMIDLIFDKVTSNEYTISYISGATTVFRGIIHSFNVDTVSDNDLAMIKIEISKGSKNPTKPNGIPTLTATTATVPGG